MNCVFHTAPIRFIPVDPDDPDYLSANIIHWQINMKPHIWRPPTDLIETAERLVIRVEIAGMNEREFSIRYDQKRVIISGCRSEIPEERCFHRMEISFGDFETEVELPQPVMFEELSAEYKDGFLLVTIPKDLPRNIPIQSEEHA